MDLNADMNGDVPAPYRGLNRYVARERVVADLERALHPDSPRRAAHDRHRRADAPRHHQAREHGPEFAGQRNDDHVGDGALG